MLVNLQPLKELKLPVIANCLSPDILEGKSQAEIENLRVWEGNKQKKLSELFKVEITDAQATPEKTELVIRGDISKVRKIGFRTKEGEVTIHGNVGMHLGEEMKGGKITVHGNAGGWVGSMMRSGTIEIHGNAGDYLAAPYRGSFEGMRGGKITVYGNVGSEAGSHMRKGVIRIHGNVGQFAGFRMREGMIYVQGDAEGRVGASMTGGKIIVNGVLRSLLPTFSIDSIKAKVKIEEGESVDGPFFVFLGDLAENGDGKLYVSRAKNPQLSRFEKLL